MNKVKAATSVSSDFSTIEYSEYEVTYRDAIGSEFSARSFFAPAITYDHVSNNYIMVFASLSMDVVHTSPTTPSQIGLLQLVMLTSATGAPGTWRLVNGWMLQNISASAPPALACNDFAPGTVNCVLAYPAADAYGTIQMTSFSLTGDGQMSVVGPTFSSGDYTATGVGLGWWDGPSFLLGWKGFWDDVGPVNYLRFEKDSNGSMYASSRGNLTGLPPTYSGVNATHYYPSPRVMFTWGTK